MYCVSVGPGVYHESIIGLVRLSPVIPLHGTYVTSLSFKGREREREGERKRRNIRKKGEI